MFDTLEFIRVLIGAMIGYVALPMLVLPWPRCARNVLDAIVVNGVRWIALVFVGTHILVVLRLYETVTIAILCGTGIWFSKLRPRGWRVARIMPIAFDGVLRLVKRMDRAEARMAGRPADVMTLPAEQARATREPMRSRAWAWIRPRLTLLVIVSPILVVMGAALLLRAELPGKHEALSPADAYVHLTWAKQLTVNVIYPDGIYPMGMASFLAFLSKWCFRVDLYDVVRFAGPITGMFIIFAIFWVTLRLSRNPGAALVAAGTLGLFGTRPEWHEPWYRQIGALPQEFTLALGLLLLAFCIMAVTQASRGWFVTIGATTLAMGLTHPVPLAIFGSVAVGVAMLVAPFRRGLRAAVRMGASAAGGALAGASFIPIAAVFGVPFYAGLSDFNPFAGSGRAVLPQGAIAQPEDLGHNTMTRLALLCVLAGSAAAMVLLAKKETRTSGLYLTSLCLLGATFLALYDVRWLGLDQFYAGRVANVVGPALTLAFGAGAGAFTLLIRKRFSVVRAVALLVIGVVALVAFGNRFPAPARDYPTIEYEAVAAQTKLIKVERERLAYTIVGTPEQRQLILGDGFHVEAWVFARDVRLRDARDPTYDLPIPTDDVYITVEKIPFPADPLPATRGPTEEFYRDEARRGRVFAAIFHWAEIYRRHHADMSVFYDDDRVRIYHIRRKADPKAAEDSKQFKDYRWRVGQHFRSGPESAAEVDL